MTWGPYQIPWDGRILLPLRCEDCLQTYRLKGLFFFFFLVTFGHAAWHMGSQFPDQGRNLHPLLGRGVLAARVPRKD